MQLDHVRMECLQIPFKQSFSHAAASRQTTETVIVKAVSQNGLAAYGEGCPRYYVTGETIASALQFFDKIKQKLSTIHNLHDLKQWVNTHAMEIDQNAAAWCAIELALLDLLAKESHQSVEALLDLPELCGCFQYSAVLGTGNMAAYTQQLQRYLHRGFTDFKVKVCGDFAQDQDKIALLRDHAKPLSVRLDANNLWNDAEQASTYIKNLNFPFRAIEEPLTVNDYAGCRKIHDALQIPIILDESFLGHAQFDYLIEDPQTWIINLRISKMGGLFRSLAIAKTAKELSIPLIIGAQVGETSILTRAALTVANACRDQIVAQEGAFGTYLLERDITGQALMFGREGKLDASGFYGKAGFAFDYQKL
ncbi:MAG: hypothetical protein E6Q62_01155 [Nitrosomonas sp.]|nr:MAG: hypothetical protein E6Q62_01155 [Nitrosomonas sp.]